MLFRALSLIALLSLLFDGSAWTSSPVAPNCLTRTDEPLVSLEAEIAKELAAHRPSDGDLLVLEVDGGQVEVSTVESNAHAKTLSASNSSNAGSPPSTPEDLAPADSRIQIKPCCQSVSALDENRVGAPARKPSAYDEGDIYFAGRGMHPPNGSPSGYTYKPPKELKAEGLSNGGTLSIPRAEVAARLLKELPPERGDLSKIVTFAGEGAQSKVYFVHEPVPNSRAFRDLPVGEVPAPRRWNWARHSAEYVIKIRNPNPWKQGIDEAARQMRRDLVMHEVADQLTSGATLDGRRFARVVRRLSTHEQHMRGVIVTEVARGPSVAAMQDAIDVIRGRIPGSVKDAENLIQETGLSVAEAERRIAALEQLYRDSHNVASRFQAVNALGGGANRTRASQNPSGATKKGEPESIPVGLDFNHGSNVIWDPDEQMFVLVDY